MKIGILGGGWCGMYSYLFFKKLHFDCTLIDKNESLGGVWIERLSDELISDSIGCFYSFYDSYIDDPIFWKRIDKFNIQKYIQEIFSSNKYKDDIHLQQNILKIVHYQNHCQVITDKNEYSFDKIIICFGNSEPYYPPDIIPYIQSQSNIPYIHSKLFTKSWLQTINPKKIAIVGVRHSGLWVKNQINSILKNQNNNHIHVDMIYRKIPLYIKHTHIPYPFSIISEYFIKNIAPFLTNYIKFKMKYSLIKIIILIHTIICYAKSNKNIIYKASNFLLKNCISYFGYYNISPFDLYDNILENIPVLNIDNVIDNTTSFIPIKNIKIKTKTNSNSNVVSNCKCWNDYDAIIFATGYRNIYSKLQYYIYDTVCQQEKQIHLNDHDFLYLYKGIQHQKLQNIFFLNPTGIDIPAITTIYVQNIFNIIKYNQDTSQIIYNQYKEDINKLLYSWYNDNFLDKHIDDFKSPFLFYVPSLIDKYK